MKRRLAVALLLAGVVSFGSQVMQGSAAATSVAGANSVTTGDCEDDEWICGPVYEYEGQKVQDCNCPVNGLWIRRPAF
jgi:hypothetical protein